MAATSQSLRFDSSGLFVPGTGVSPADLEALYPQLEAARRELLSDELPTHDSGGVTIDGPEMGIGLADHPDRILADYRAHRQRSELGRILTAARRLAESVDRVVIVADNATLLAACALMNACCHPYHNELSRAERGGQPRMYFAGRSLDNDALAGLLDLLRQDSPAAGPQACWGLISAGGSSMEQAVGGTRSVLLHALDQACGGDPRPLARKFISIGPAGNSADQPDRDFGGNRFDLPAGAGGAGSVFAAAGLLAAATLGIDVRRLLEGVVGLNLHFRQCPPADNLVLSYVGACRLMQGLAPAQSPRLVAWADGLNAFVRWTGAQCSMVGGISAAHLPALAGQNRFTVNLLVDEARRDRIALACTAPDRDAADQGAIELLPDILAATVRQTRQGAADAGQPWVALHLPRLDEAAIGQLFQMFILVDLLKRHLPPAPDPPSNRGTCHD